jgi:DNA-binding CsgD family transcriptional regulator
MAYKLHNIEFQRTQDRSIIYQQAGGEFVMLTEKDPIIVILDEKIKTEYPEAYAVLDKEFSKSRADIRKHRFDIVCAFLSCNCGGSDERMDIDEDGDFNFETANCPSLFCKYRGVVCCGKFKTNMTKRQEETMWWYIHYMRMGFEPQQIRELVGAKLGISPETVDTNKRDAFDREGVNSMAEFILKMEGKL